MNIQIFSHCRAETVSLRSSVGSGVGQSGAFWRANANLKINTVLYLYLYTNVFYVFVHAGTYVILFALFFSGVEKM